MSIKLGRQVFILSATSFAIILFPLFNKESGRH